MNDLKRVIDLCVEFLNVRLTFGDFSFTPLSVMIGVFVLSIAVAFVSKLFS